jgi:hypothetical protein
MLPYKKDNLKKDVKIRLRAMSFIKASQFAWTLLQTSSHGVFFASCNFIWYSLFSAFLNHQIMTKLYGIWKCKTFYCSTIQLLQTLKPYIALSFYSVSQYNSWYTKPANTEQSAFLFIFSPCCQGMSQWLHTF